MSSQLEHAARDLASAMAGRDLKARIALIEATVPGRRVFTTRCDGDIRIGPGPFIATSAA